MRHTILVINSKGGCGKTTIASNLASYYANQGLQTALVDCDPQGSSTKWHRIRNNRRPQIHIVAAFGKARSATATRAWQLAPPVGTERVIIDAPAGVRDFHLEDYVRRVDTILIPVLPSSIDIYAASDFIRDLLLAARARVHKTRLAIVANRVRVHTNAYAALLNFLQALNIPFVTSLRDTRNYVFAAEQGLGIHELPAYRVRDDLKQWTPLFQWLENGVIQHMENTGSGQP